VPEEPQKASMSFMSGPVKLAWCRRAGLADFANMILGRILGLFLLAGPLVHIYAQISVLTQHNNDQRTGANLGEVTLTPSNVNTKQFGMLFRRVVDDQVYGQPLYVSNVRLRGGTHDLVYVTTVNNSVYAFDANDAYGSEPFWHVNFGVPPNVYDGQFGCTDMNGNMGIIGTPVIDAQAGTLYVVAATNTGNGFMQRLHALDLATGADRGQSPVTITAPGFDPLMQNQRPGLLLSRGKVYIGYGSHCDKEPYHGFLISYDAKSLQQTGSFNTSPEGQAASIWQFGQAPCCRCSMATSTSSRVTEAGMADRTSAKAFSNSTPA
jgi:hypothetical protein